jgi:proton-translocating NADH-quinone oxidoreductase chain N
MAINMLIVTLPILCFVILSVVTIPVMGSIHKLHAGRTALSLVWFVVVYAITFTAVIYLAVQYYSATPLGSYMITLAGVFEKQTFPYSGPAIYYSAFLVDPVSIFMAILFVGLSSVVFLYTIFFVKGDEKPVERYLALMLAVTGCLIGAILAGDLLTLFIFWEASAGSVAILIIYEKSREAIRAAMKYIIMIIIASCLIVYGLSIIYGLDGSLNYWTLQADLTSPSNFGLAIFAFVLITAGYATEAAVVPFHMWLPDAYAAAPASSSAFISALIDQGSYYILLRVFIYILPRPPELNWPLMMAVLATITMVVANMLALTERNVKRLFAYICIADIGYNLVAIVSLNPIGIEGNLYFFLNGGITIALAFMSVGIMNAHGVKTLDDFRGVGRRMPWTSAALVIGTLSFAGIPPLAGFFAKWLVFTAAIAGGYAWLAVIGVIMSVVQACYLIILYTGMFSRRPGQIRLKEPRSLLVPIYILLLAIVIFGIFPHFVLNLISPVLASGVTPFP